MTGERKSPNRGLPHFGSMNPWPFFTVFLLLLVAAVGPVGAAGTGTFLLEDTEAVIGERAITTRSLNSSWEPAASDLWMTLRFDPAAIRYESTRSLVGAPVTATRTQAGRVLVLLSDTTGFQSGPLLEFSFTGLVNGSSTLDLEIGHVRAYPNGRPLELASSASARAGTFVVLNSTAVTIPSVPATSRITSATTAGGPVPTYTRPPLTLPPPATPPTTILHGDDYSGAVSTTITPVASGTVPASNLTVLEIIAANPEFSTFARAVSEAGLSDVLDGPGPVTAFVPTDTAFAALPPGALDDLFEDRTALAVLLAHHLAPGTLSVADVTANARVPTLLGKPLRVAVRPGGAVGIDGANLTLLDIPAKNGMVHIVDGVLFPPGQAPTSVATPMPSGTSPSSTSVPVTQAGPGLALVVLEVLTVATFLGYRRRW